MIITDTDTDTRQAATNALAVIGFIALIVLGIALAIYSARFVPGIVDRFGAAAVYLGSVFTPGSEPSLSVVTTPTTTPPFSSTPVATSTPPVVTTPEGPVPTTPSAPRPTAPTRGAATSTTVVIGGATSTPSLHGLADLIVTIDAVGYLASASAESFVASSTVPAGSRPAVKFTIKNIGTNVTSGQWRFTASLPTQSSYTYQSQLQQSLLPGDSITYTLGFDQPRTGSNQTVQVTANPDHLVGESVTTNNGASANLTIIGS